MRRRDMLKPDIIRECQDMRHLSWTRVRNSSGTVGTYLKAFGKEGGKKIYYKLSNYDSVHGVIGHENVNEIIADRLLTILGIPHLSYQLMFARIIPEDKEVNAWICASEDFKEAGETKLALDDYYDMMKMSGESPLAFCIRNGWTDYIREMLLADFLLCNRDRHGANMEVLMKRKEGSVRLAPLFDHGLSLLYSCHTEEEVRQFDIMADRPVQCFVGSRSAFDNLKMTDIQGFPEVRPLEERDRSILLQGLDAACPEYLLNRIWEMIWKRWKYYESMRNQR